MTLGHAIALDPTSGPAGDRRRKSDEKPSAMQAARTASRLATSPVRRRSGNTRPRHRLCERLPGLQEAAPTAAFPLPEVQAEDGQSRFRRFLSAQRETNGERDRGGVDHGSPNVGDDCGGGQEIDRRYGPKPRRRLLGPIKQRRMAEHRAKKPGRKQLPHRDFLDVPQACYSRPRYALTPGSGAHTSPGSVPLCQNTSIGMPPRGWK